MGGSIRFLRRGVKAAQRHRPPILHDGDLQRLWDNTIGFLRRGAALLERYGVPRKRGVLLLGEPGNGKTMACRWLRWQCSRRGLGWRAVTAEEYEAAKGDGGAHELFDLDRPGIVFFDDVDVVAATDGLSFAELEELKKLLVLRYGETGCWEWFWAWSAFTAGRGDAGSHRKIGFNGVFQVLPSIA